VPPKIVLALTFNLKSRQVSKFCRATPLNSEVISAHLLHFKPIVDQIKKSCKGSPRLRWGCPSKTWSFSSACKNSGSLHLLWAEIWFSEKCVLGGLKWALIT